MSPFRRHAACLVRMHVMPPVGSREILIDRSLQPLFEVDLRLPAEGGLDLRRVGAIAPVVARPVADEGNELAPGPVMGERQARVEEIAYPLNDLDVAPLATSRDEIG